MVHLKKIDPDDLFLELFIGRRYRWLRHIAFMGMILCLGISNVYSDRDHGWIWLLNMLVFIPGPILLNAYVFVPKLLLRNRPNLYVLASVSVVLLCLFGGFFYLEDKDSVVTRYFDDPQPLLPILNVVSTLMMFGLIMAGTTSLLIMQLWLRDRIRIAELEKASNLAELEMLKNQINPHFLFNMLNNAIVLTRERAPEAREVILKLREMLNYQFEKSSMDFIPLRGDIDFLEDLLHLEKIRRDRFDYQILVSGDTEQVEVPPLLFIPFVENAVKHGNDNTRESYILMTFNVDNGTLEFFCINSVPDHARQAAEGGLGLRNICRRLELIYGKDYRLDIQSTPQLYSVNLTIKL